MSNGFALERESKPKPKRSQVYSRLGQSLKNVSSMLLFSCLAISLTGDLCSLTICVFCSCPRLGGYREDLCGGYTEVESANKPPKHGKIISQNGSLLQFQGATTNKQLTNSFNSIEQSQPVIGS